MVRESPLEQIRSRNPRQAAIARRQLEIFVLFAASGVPARWMRAADEGSDDARETLNTLIESLLNAAKCFLPYIRRGIILKNEL